MVQQSSNRRDQFCIALKGKSIQKHESYSRDTLQGVFLHTMVKISKQRRKYSKCHTLKIVFLTIAASIGISFLVMSWLDSLFSIWRQGIHSESTLRRGMHEKDEGYRNNQGQRSSPVNEVNWDLDDVVDTNDHSTIMKHYRKLRVEHESKHPLSDSERMKDFVKSVRNDPYEPIFTKEDDEIDYDVFNCPEHPPNDYPKEWNVLEVIQNWNPDDPDPPQKPHIYQGLCVFQHSTEYQKALNYRNAEKPFIIRDDPLVLETVERWHQPDYLTTLLGGQTLHRTEYSHNNHFMYWKMNHKKKNGDWKPPTENIQMSYTQWLKNAKEMEKESNYEKNEDHWYFRLNSCQKGRSCNIEQTDYLFHEVPFLKPKKSIYIVDEDDTRGINCRFGMKGNIAGKYKRSQDMK